MQLYSKSAKLQVASERAYYYSNIDAELYECTTRTQETAVQAAARARNKEIRTKKEYGERNSKTLDAPHIAEESNMTRMNEIVY